MSASICPNPECYPAPVMELTAVEKSLLRDIRIAHLRCPKCGCQASCKMAEASKAWRKLSSLGSWRAWKEQVS